MKTLFLILTTLLLIVKPVIAQSDLELIDETLTLNSLKAHIDFIASDELKGRETGSEGIDIAAKYIATQLSSYGVLPIDGTNYQEIEINILSQPDSTLLELKKDSHTDLLTLDGSDLSFEGKAIFVGFGSKDDFAEIDVKDKIVLAKGGLSDKDGLTDQLIGSNEKRKRAIDRGAIALIEFVKIPEKHWKPVGSFVDNHMNMKLADKSVSLSTLWVRDSDGAIIEGFKKGKNVKASLLVKGSSIERIKSKNVIGMIEGTDPVLKNEYVVYSAHYDHIGIGKANAEGDSIFNGARDNAVGVATMLSTAKNIVKYPTKRSVLFAFVTGEERGFVGSRWFVNSPPIPLKNIVYCINSDNGGYNDTTAVTIVGHKKTTMTNLINESIEQTGLSVIMDPMPEQNLYERSDNWSFAKEGIPSINISMGISEFDAEITKYYHQTADNPESLNYDYLLKYFRAYINLARKVANSPQTPFWSDGDNYYSKGIGLYGER